SFGHERPKIDAALAAGVGGFIVFGGTREPVLTLTRELRAQAGRPLLVGADLERGPAQEVQGLTELPPPAALGWLDDLEATRATVRCVRAAGAGLRQLDVAPCEYAIRAGVGSVMGAFVAYPDWDPTGRAASFWPAILGYLRDTLNFGGLVVTDAVIMAGAS